MTRPLLHAFVAGTRAMLSAQLLLSILAVALAGWTLAVTDQLIRERDLLQQRVVQLEGSLAERGIVVPATPAVVGEEQRSNPVYPASIAEAAASGAPPQRDLSRVVGDLFAPPPALRTLVLHVRNPADAAVAEDLRAELQDSAGVRVIVNVAPERARQSGYAYFDGRQSRAAADLVAAFHELARQRQIAPWSAQLRGTALPAQGEYAADRIDLVLPALPAPPTPVAAPPAAAVAPPG